MPSARQRISVVPSKATFCTERAPPCGPRRRRIGVGLRHAAGVGEAARERVRARERDDGAPHAVLGGAARREEARRAARHAQVLDRRGVALGVVAVEQRLAGLALRAPARASSRGWPASWMPLLPPRAPNGQTTCAASPMKIVRPTRKVSSRWSRYWYGPIQTNSNSTSGPSCARSRAPATSGRLIDSGSQSLGHLVVEAPDVVGHQVLPDGAAFVERRVDPGPALGRRTAS